MRNKTAFDMSANNFLSLTYKTKDFIIEKAEARNGGSKHSNGLESGCRE